MLATVFSLHGVHYIGNKVVCHCVRKYILDDNVFNWWWAIGTQTIEWLNTCMYILDRHFYGRVVKGLISEHEGPGLSPETADFLTIVAVLTHMCLCSPNRINTNRQVFSWQKLTQGCVKLVSTVSSRVIALFPLSGISQLSLHVRQSPSIKTFKRNLKTHIFTCDRTFHIRISFS